MEYSPGDIVHAKRERGSDRYYFIEAVCLGGEEQRSVVEVIFADERSLPAATNAEGEWEQREVHHVPISLFEAALEAEVSEVYESFDAMENPVFA
jgi:hypothetical protein